MAEFELPLSPERRDAKLFALSASDLLANLPAFVDPKRSVIAVLYEDVYESEVAAIRFQDGKYAVRVFTYYNTASDSDDAESDYVAGHVGGYSGDQTVFAKVPEMQKILCNAPLYLDRVHEAHSKLLLESRPDANKEDLRRCVEYCYDLICIRRWYRSVLYIDFPSCNYCVRV